MKTRTVEIINVVFRISCAGCGAETAALVSIDLRRWLACRAESKHWGAHQRSPNLGSQVTNGGIPQDRVGEDRRERKRFCGLGVLDALELEQERHRLLNYDTREAALSLRKWKMQGRKAHRHVDCNDCITQSFHPCTRTHCLAACCRARG